MLLQIEINPLAALVVSLTCGEIHVSQAKGERRYNRPLLEKNYPL